MLRKAPIARRAVFAGMGETFNTGFALHGFYSLFLQSKLKFGCKNTHAVHHIRRQHHVNLAGLFTTRSTRKPAIKAFLPSTKPAASHSPNRAIISGAQAAGGYHVSADGVIITQFVARKFGGDAAAQTGAQISQGAHGCQIVIGCFTRGVGGSQATNSPLASRSTLMVQTPFVRAVLRWA